MNDLLGIANDRNVWTMSHHNDLSPLLDLLYDRNEQAVDGLASHDVYMLMRTSANGDLPALRRLQFDIFDQPAWEEPVLFAVDRLSRESDGSSILAKAVMEALPVDPMLAAEMIYRLPTSVWEMVKADIQAFVKRWHKPGEVDRAVRFMIMTGRSDFESIIWPLASSANSKDQLPTLRSAPRFRPAVLGTNLKTKVAALPETTREHLLALIAYESGVDGMDVATDLAITDPSPKIQAEVVQYLQFRRADRHVARLLKNALDETWELIARRGYAEEIRDPAAAARLSAVRNGLIEKSSNPLEKLGMLLEQSPAYQGRDEAIEELIADPYFPVRDQKLRIDSVLRSETCPSSSASSSAKAA